MCDWPRREGGPPSGNGRPEREYLLLGVCARKVTNKGRVKGVERWGGAVLIDCNRNSFRREVVGSPREREREYLLLGVCARKVTKQGKCATNEKLEL